MFRMIKEEFCMNRLKRPISFLLTLLLLLSAVAIAPLTVSAAIYDGYTYDATGGEATITGYGGHEDKIIIPSELEGFKVTAIGDDAFNGSYVSSVVIPNTVTSIGDSAFKGCADLTSVTIPSSVTAIGEEAFTNCADDFTIYGNDPSTAKDYANTNHYKFVNCFDFSYEPYYDGVTITSYIGIEKVVYIPSEFNGKSVIDVDNHAFSGNTTITDVIIPSGVTAIGVRAFYECSNLESIIIPASVTNIGSEAFFGCSANLKIIGAPDSKAAQYANSNHLAFVEDNSSDVSSFDDFEFSEPDEYGKITVLKYKGDGGSVVIPSTVNGKAVEAIADMAFYCAVNITSVTIPKGVTSIGAKAFYGCRALENVSIPTTVGRIGEYAFTYCKGLESIKLPDSVTTIGAGAFYGCENLTKVTLSDNLEAISNSAFKFCKSLRQISIPASVERIGDYAFANSGLFNMAIGKNVETIGSNAFSNCVNLRGLVISDSVTRICKYAFYNCNELTGDLILTNVNLIENNAFEGCSKLNSAAICNVDTYFGGNNVFKGHKAEFRIFGYDPSTAKTFAEENTIPFFLLDEYDSANPTHFYYKSVGDSKVTYVSTFRAAWTQAIMDGGVVGILEDVDIPSHLEVPVDTKVTLELNGHVIDRCLSFRSDDEDEEEQDKDNVIVVNNRAELTVYGGKNNAPQPSCTSTIVGWNTKGELQAFEMENVGVITGGYTDKSGGGILVNEGATLNLYYTAVSGNCACAVNSRGGFGGGVCLYGNYAHLNMHHSEISHNFARFGGGVAIRKGSVAFTGTRDNSSIVGDTDAYKGEILSSITSNYASSNGGGVFVNNDYCTIYGVSVDNNFSAGDGGGMHMNG
ncbi:MAG: leucine-rich repeat domain-containing protein, partial [Ruminococcus sp.]|nr:leucine-rich repeat domain-containing protein [Ruminococcus sp.]